MQRGDERHHMPPPEEELTEEERRRARLDDPEVRAKIEEIFEIIRRGGAREPGITAEELPAFLREHGL